MTTQDLDMDAFWFVDYFVTRRKDGTYILTKQPEEMEEALKKLLLQYLLGTEEQDGESST